MNQTHILLVEDDAVIREATQLSLERDGFRVTVAEDGITGLEKFRSLAPDVALLDLMLPGMNGVSLCRQIREESPAPVIMMSARADPIDVVLGLEAGADDYVTKPFDSTVLVARIRAVMRRMGRAEEVNGEQPLRFGDLEVHRNGLEVRVGGKPVELTPTELRLLLCFVDSPGSVLTRDVLLEQVWDYQWGGDSRVVDVHVQRLRAKVGQDRIETVRGFGYKLRTAS
ncbi:two-component system response regulator CseB [Kibdelosporangium persicum]|uniref:Phosphate regulon transcriptional regulatory protein PhoB n=1 Tax=Kibdelosporangium persicum TaxID=2698649 RepID=A0ABX2F3N7_9PSEU|nr:two-component system response regulator CseB [Kibdelosporangium persicum]NRN65949.1 Phosphate regulon transcriptional regulatory protein PhoB [Kibdelosporangium persicum]